MSTRAIVLTARRARADASAPPACLELLLDRPWLHHLVEQLVLGGIREVDLVVDAGADAIERELAGEERWGATIRVHRPPYPDLAEALRRAAAEPEVLVADAEVLVAADVWSDRRPPRAELETYHGPRDRGRSFSLEWTGWCRCAGHLLNHAATGGSAEVLLGSLLDRARSTASLLCVALSAREPRQLLEANRFVLAGRGSFVALRGRRGPTGIWKERGVKIHPTARVIPPVYLGELVEIGADAAVGPNVVLGAGCIVDAHARVADSVLPAATYVAPEARCEQVVGSRTGEFRRASGDTVAGELADALVAMDRVSLAAQIKAELSAAVNRLVSLVESSARFARGLVLHAPQPRAIEVAEDVYEENHGATLSH